VLDKSAGDFGNLDEGTSSKIGANINCIINGVDGIIKCNGSFVELDSFQSSDFIDDVQMLSVLNQAIFSSGKGSLGFSLLKGAGSELRLSSLEGTGGISHFLRPESKFTDTFDFLSLVDVIMLDLLLVDSRLKSVQNTFNGIQGTSGLEFVFHL
jgi:hypothetical protein